jgi:hypothetical protein
MSETSILLANNGRISRDQLATVPTAAPTANHRPIAHHEIVDPYGRDAQPRAFETKLPIKRSSAR